MNKPTRLKLLDILFSLFLTLFSTAAAAEQPPSSYVVGISRPVPQGFALNPNQQILATLHANGAILSNLKTMKETRKLGKDEPPSSAVAFSADGALVAIGHEQGVVSLWRLDGHRVTWVKGHLDRVMALAFSQDGQWLASGGYDGTVQIWSTKTWKRIATLDGSVPVCDDYCNQAVLGLSFSADSRFIYSLETIYSNAYQNGSRNIPRTRVFSAWKAGSWLEVARVSRGLKDMSVNGHANPLDAPFAVTNWGKPQVILAANDGYGYPGKVISPTLEKLRSIALDECSQVIISSYDHAPSDTWPTALAENTAKGWLAAAYLEGWGSPGIALIPQGGGGVQRNWLTSKQSIQIAFDGSDHLYALSADGQVIAYEIGPLQTLAPAKTVLIENKKPTCRSESESPFAQETGVAEPGTLVELAKWPLDPDILKSLLAAPYSLTRIDLVGDTLNLWRQRDRTQFDAKTGTVIKREPELRTGETLIPSRMGTSLIIARSDAIFEFDTVSGNWHTLERMPGRKLIGAATAGDYLATAWRNESETTKQPVEFHVLSITGRKASLVKSFPPARKIFDVSIDPNLSLQVSEDGRWLLYQVLTAKQGWKWLVLDTQTGEGQLLEKPLQGFEGSKLLVPDARWMGLSIFNAETMQVETRIRRHVNRFPNDHKDWPNRQIQLRGALSVGAKNLVSSAVDGSIKVWDVKTRAMIAHTPGSGTAVSMPQLGFDQQDETRFFALDWGAGAITLWQMQEAHQ